MPTHIFLLPLATDYFIFFDPGAPQDLVAIVQGHGLTRGHRRLGRAKGDLYFAIPAGVIRARTPGWR